jgi:hypothetical protein
MIPFFSKKRRSSIPSSHPKTSTQSRIPREIQSPESRLWKCQAKRPFRCSHHTFDSFKMVPHQWGRRRCCTPVGRACASRTSFYPFPRSRSDRAKRESRNISGNRTSSTHCYNATMPCQCLPLRHKKSTASTWLSHQQDIPYLHRAVE